MTDVPHTLAELFPLAQRAAGRLRGDFKLNWLSHTGYWRAEIRPGIAPAPAPIASSRVSSEDAIRRVLLQLDERYWMEG